MKKIYLLLALIISCLGLNAQSVGTIFSTDVNGNAMNFRITKGATIDGEQFKPGSVEVCGFEAPSTATSVSVSIPESVTYRNTPFTVTAIGENAFEDNEQIASVVIPSTITNIKEFAFYYCDNLSNVVFLEPTLEQIGNSAFAFCTSLANIIIPNTVTSIGVSAFSECLNLSSITFADNSQLTTIGTAAFSKCEKLTDIEIPSGVTTIADEVFEDCLSLASVVFPENLTSIGNRAFFDCYKLTDVEIPSGVTMIGSYAFNCCLDLTNINIPSGVTTIAEFVFAGCLSLTNIKIPASVTLIGYSAFGGCKNLGSVTIENHPIAPLSKLESIDDYAFNGCESLTEIVLPKSLTDLSSYAFKDCTNLNTIIIDADSIPENLSTIIISSPFQNCPSDMTIYVPVNSVELYKEAEYWGDYTILPVITVPDNIEVTGTSTSSVAITWDPVPNAEGYCVVYGEYTPGESVDLDSVVYLNINYPAAFDTISQFSAEVGELSLYTEYCFSVIAARANSTVYEKVCGKTMDLPVAAPTNVTAEPSSPSSTILAWNAVENAYSYNVYRNNEFVKNVTQVICTDTGLAENTEYCYTITAVRNETESEASEEVCATTLTIDITAPTNLEAEATSSSSIDLTWSAAANAMSYNIYQGNTVLANVTATNYTVEGLEHYTEYCYTVTAIRNDNETGKSNEACVTTLDLDITAPANLSATPESTSEISLTWDEVENAMSYNIYRDNELVTNITTTTYTDSGLEYDTEYCYTVSAIRNETESEVSEEVCAKTLGDGIEEVTAAFEIYPNPANDKLYIEAETNIEKITIYNLTGIAVQDEECRMQNVELNVTDLNSGIYFIKIKTENNEVVKRIVKK